MYSYEERGNGNGTKILGEKDMSMKREALRTSLLSGHMHIEERLNEGSRLR